MKFIVVIGRQLLHLRSSSHPWLRSTRVQLFYLWLLHEVRIIISDDVCIMFGTYSSCNEAWKKFKLELTNSSKFCASSPGDDHFQHEKVHSNLRTFNSITISNSSTVNILRCHNEPEVDVLHRINTVTERTGFSIAGLSSWLFKAFLQSSSRAWWTILHLAASSQNVLTACKVTII